MNSVNCKICKNTFLSDTKKGKIQPWDCPKCNKDSDESIQQDLNELFKIDGLLAIDSILPRIDRLDELSRMTWKQENSRTEDLRFY